MRGRAFQCGALPFRRRADMSVEVMLITSRETGRWLIPKGWPVPGLSAQNSAAREAREEGGVLGRISEQAIGNFHYQKRLADGSAVTCAVEVFALEVDRQTQSWPERGERRRRWFALQEAADAVQEPELQALIRNLATSLPRGSPGKLLQRESRPRRRVR
jgi:8-oxo-dGTP pyrophosphatase MutT (NUDIX family)